MKTMLKAFGIAAFCAVIAVASGCEDSPITVGKDDILSVAAQPRTINNPPYQSRIVATVSSITGAPKKGVLVFFSADVQDALASGGSPVSTDSNGNAYDTLTIDPDGPGDIVVTADSSSLSDSVTVTNGACDANTPPSAPVFTVGTPVDGPTVGQKTLNLTAIATDSDGHIVSWSWDCGNQSQGGTTAVGTCVYTVGTGSQIYQITLTVKDDGNGGNGPTYSCQKSNFTTHSVTIAP